MIHQPEKEPVHPDTPIEDPISRVDTSRGGTPGPNISMEDYNLNKEGILSSWKIKLLIMMSIPRKGGG